MSESLDLTIELVAKPSVSPNDAGCLNIISQRLAKLDFAIEPMNFGETSNLWATHGKEAPILAFIGHTDVVPTGPSESWTSPPFEPVVRDGMLYGRGSADMKSGIACFVTAVERFMGEHKEHKGTLAFLLTSDEEADSSDGTIKVVEHLTRQGTKVEYCLVGEPSASATVGDTIKNGRRGSLTGRLRVKGQQGHVAYPEHACNPVHKCLAALDQIASKKWDEGNKFFPPTSFQISNMNAGTGADNVIPGTVDIVFNIRFSTEQTADGLKQAVHAILDKHGLDYDLVWRLSGHPFLTAGGKLLDAVVASVKEVSGLDPILSTAGGTSDGRILAPTGSEVVELGLVNASIHKIDEHAKVADMDTLSTMFQRILEKMLL